MDEKRELKPEETSEVSGGITIKEIGKKIKDRIRKLWNRNRKSPDTPVLMYGGPPVTPKVAYGGPAVKPIAKLEKTEEKEQKE